MQSRDYKNKQQQSFFLTLLLHSGSLQHFFRAILIQHSIMSISSNKLCKGPKLTKDRGYAWVVIIFGFFSCFLSTGFSYGVVGNLTIAHKQKFNIDLRESSMIGSVYSGAMYLFGKYCIFLANNN